MITMEKRYYIEGSRRYPMEYQIRQAQQLLAPHQNHTLTQHDPGDALDPLPDLYPHDFFFNTKQTQAGGMNYTDSSPHLRRVYPRRDKQTQTNDEGINFDLDLRISAYLELPEEPDEVLAFESSVPPPRVDRDKSLTLAQTIHQSIGQSSHHGAQIPSSIVPHSMSLSQAAPSQNQPPQLSSQLQMQLSSQLPYGSTNQYENGLGNGLSGLSNGIAAINGMHNAMGERRYSYYGVQDQQPQTDTSTPSMNGDYDTNGLGSGDKQFKCDQCECSFRRNHDLRRHKRSHLPVRPFPCTTCSRSFSRKDALKRHLAANACERGKKKRKHDYDDDESS